MSRCVSLCSMLLLLATALPLGQAASGNEGSNATAAISDRFFNKIFTNMLPAMEAVALSHTFGPYTNNDDYKVDSFKLSQFSISGGVTTSFTSPATVAMHLSGLTMSIPRTDFKVWKHLDKTNHSVTDFTPTCHGSISGGVSGASADIAVVLTLKDGKVLANAATCEMHGDSFSVTPDCHSCSLLSKKDNKNDDDIISCSFVSDILKLMSSAINSLVTSEANKYIPEEIQKELNDEFSKYLPQVPYNVVKAPVVVNGALEITVQLLSRHSDLPAPSSGTSTVQPHIYTNKDVSFGINTPSFNDIIAYEALNHKFDFSMNLPASVNTSDLLLVVPLAYLECPDCPMNVTFALQQQYPPMVKYGSDSMSFALNNVLMNFSAIQPSTGKVVPLFTVESTIILAIVNVSAVNTAGSTTTYLKFDFALDSFTAQEYHSYVGNISGDIALLTKVLQGTIDGSILPQFNEHFQGLPLDLVADGFGLDDWSIDLDQNAVSLGANLVLPSSTQARSRLSGSHFNRKLMNNNRDQQLEIQKKNIKL